MSQIEIKYPMLWAVSGLAEYESSWMAFHRFLWMNAIDGAGLWRKMIGSERLKLPMPSSGPFADRYIEMMSNCYFIKDFFSHFKRRSFAECYGINNAQLICGTQSLRYCPLCLNSCFHSPFFQFATIDACPYHHVPLIMGCVHCGQRLGVPRFDPNHFSHPMCCQSCNKPFVAGRFTWKLVAGSVKGVEEFAKIEKEMGGIRNIQFKSEYVLHGEPWSPKLYKKICQSMAGIGVDREHLIAGGLRISEKWSESNILQSHDYLSNRIKFPLFDEVNALVPIAKSINRYIAKKMHSICKHKKTSKLPWGTHDRPFVAAAPVISAGLNDCPCCALLDQWRAYAGKIIALRNVLGEQDPRYEDYGLSVRVQYCLMPNIFSEALVSSFSWFVCTFCEHMDCLHDEHSPYWFRDERPYLEGRVPTNVIRFDTYRSHLQMFGFIMKDESNSEIFVVLSLRNAFKRLKEYFDDVYSVRYKFRKNYSRIDMDDWYLGMSEHFINLDSRSWRYGPIMNDI